MKGFTTKQKLKVKLARSTGTDLRYVADEFHR